MQHAETIGDRMCICAFPTALQEMNSYLKMIWRIALASTTALVISSFFINLNGEFPYIGATASFMLSLMMFAVAIGSGLVIIVKDKARRLMALVLLALIFILLAPAIFG
jgi:glucose uptake protein GlcU